MNSFKLLGFRRKLAVLSFVESFFEFHSSATERKSSIKIKQKKSN